jgi:hypothetical protein
LNRQIGTLLTILLLQCGLVAVMYWPHSTIMDDGEIESLLPFDPDKVDEIYIEDEKGNESVLLKMEGQWLLPDLAGIPIDPEMIATLLSSLSNRAGDWPIATTAASRQRFQVAAYHYQRRLTMISEGELLGTIYLGTSPGFRKVHARNDAQSAIFSIPFNNYDAPATTSAWMDKTLLQISAPEKISTSGYTLSKQGDEWGSAEGGRPDERELAALLLGLRSLQVEGVADEDMQRTLSIAAPQLSLEVETAQGISSLNLIKLGNGHYISSNKYDYFFTLSAYDFDRLATIDDERLRGQVTAHSVK